MVDPAWDDPINIKEGGTSGSTEAAPAGSEQTPPAVPPQLGLQRQQTANRNLADVVLYNRFWRASAIRRYNLQRVTRLVWLLATLLEQLFAIRFVLKLIAANPSAGFARFIYDVSGLFLLPFFGLTGSPSALGSVFETFTLIAMVAYALLAWAIARTLWIIFEEPVVQ
jgi:hypothetical protein